GPAPTPPLRRAMAGRLPETVLRQRKRGFSLPIAGWFAGELREFVQDHLAPGRIRRQGLFDPDAVAGLVRAHVRREADHSRAIWALLFFVVWHDEVLDAARPGPAMRPVTCATQTLQCRRSSLSKG